MTARMKEHTTQLVYLNLFYQNLLISTDGLPEVMLFRVDLAARMPEETPVRCEARTLTEAYRQAHRLWGKLNKKVEIPAAPKANVFLVIPYMLALPITAEDASRVIAAEGIESVAGCRFTIDPRHHGSSNKMVWIEHEDLPGHHPVVLTDSKKHLAKLRSKGHKKHVA